MAGRPVRAVLAAALAGASAVLAPAGASLVAAGLAAAGSLGFPGAYIGGRRAAGFAGGATPGLFGRAGAPAGAWMPGATSDGRKGPCAVGFSAGAGRKGVKDLRASALISAIVRDRARGSGLGSVILIVSWASAPGVEGAGAAAGGRGVARRGSGGAASWSPPEWKCVRTLSAMSSSTALEWDLTSATPISCR